MVVHLQADWVPVRDVMEGTFFLLLWCQMHVCPCTFDSDTGLLICCHDGPDLLMEEVRPLWVQAEVSPEEGGPSWCP